MSAHGLPPLFERLATQEDDQAFDLEALCASVSRELSRLLNSRSPARGGCGILDYGILDWTALQARRDSDRRLLTREIRRAIQRFEPRLELADVVVEADPQQPQRLRVRLLGNLRQDPRRAPLLFDLTPTGGTLEVRHERLD
ncbi:type VI secretion system baseplate subunit TssE [Pseudomonas sp. GD04087]|uniref:type VI secretion system baseplate subunit TssE n=1 Tax=Pseudomonas TaxID=286 RepID=UPI001F48CDC5|nr:MULTISPECIES: type VI secretion system baseplate subunit TssE [Pseudomonas]MDH0292034.1 type VI secretion system baseplate subunit TssE [Pseudomonas sp. GD04087]MDH1052624.1 type VI secretion system baseplate subunit TssE [Pseudomonas sp. GD03903]MDH2001481.1 type VI secretion system baseplate subunit TssE [Pseudomonas sp. GD03691]